MTQPGAENLVRKICRLYRVSYSTELVKDWYEALSRIDDQAASQALNSWVEEEQRAPTPAGIIRATSGTTEKIPQESPEQLMKRLNRRASLHSKQRLEKGDEQELRFQEFMARKRVREGKLTQEDSAYFHRILGPQRWGELCREEKVR